MKNREKKIHQNQQVKEGLIETEQVLNKQAKELTILNQLSVAISSSLDLDEIEAFIRYDYSTNNSIKLVFS